MITEERVITLLAECNPVPDPAALDLSVDLDSRSWEMTEMRTDERIRVDLGGEKPRRALIIGVAAAVLVVGVLIFLQPDDGAPVARPTDTLPEPTLYQQTATPEEIATGFVEAYGAYDLESAGSYLAPTVKLAGFGEDWQLNRRFLDSIGFTLLLDSCEKQTDGVSVPVRCTFDYHALGSDQIGRGPYTGNYFDLIIRSGSRAIVNVSQHLEYESNGFSRQMWEPFAAWVADNYPEDAAVMYADWPNQSLQATTDESLSLWEQRSIEYAGGTPVPDVDYVLDLNTGEMTPLPPAILSSLAPTEIVKRAPGLQAQYAATSDGSLLAYVGTGDDGSLQIFIAGFDGTDVRQVTHHPTDATSPAWSPDGAMIAYQASEGLFVLDVATGESRQVPDAPPGAYGPQFTRDSSSLLYTGGIRRGDRPESPGNNNFQLWTVPIVGGNSTVLIGREQGMGAAGSGSLSPDGSLVTMLGHKIGGPGAARFLADTDGSEPRYMDELGSGNCWSIPAGTWSPDGSRIVCSGDGGVLVVDVARGETTRVADGRAAIWLDDHTLLIEGG